jgi:hypothetical protein
MKKMTSKERVLQILDHKEPDRVPLGEFGIDHDTVEKVIGRETYWRAKAKTTKALWAGKRDEVVESYKKDLVELVKKLDQDLVPVHLVPPKNFGPKSVERLDENTWKDEQGQIWKYSEGNDALLLVSSPRRVFKSKDEIKDYFERELVKRCGFKIRGQNSDGYDLELDDESRLELVRYVVDKLGNEKFIFGRGFEEAIGSIEPLHLSEFEVASIFFGGTVEDFFLAIALQPELVKEAFDLYSQINIAMARVFIEEGVDAVMPGGDFSDSNGPMVSPESIRDIFLPGMKKLSDYVHQSGIRVISHNCGNNWKIMDVLISAGYDCWQSIQSKTADMDLKRLKEKYGNKITFWGGINIESLYDGTPEENRKDVLYALRYAAPGGGFILGTSNSVSYGSSYDNYMAALETLHRYGSYPIKVDLINGES